MNTEWSLSNKKTLEPVGHKFGDYVLLSQSIWRRDDRSYVDVQCPHSTDRVNLNSLRKKKKSKKGCAICHDIRNDIFRTEDKELYVRFNTIYNRCYRKTVNGYHRYGGAGITICQEWLDNPQLFIDYVKSLPNFSLNNTIDRIENDLGYCPGNIRWATPKQQANNRTTNVIVSYAGKTMTLIEFAREYCPDVRYAVVREQYNAGRTTDELVGWKPQQGKSLAYNRRQDILWVEWDNKTMHFKDFVANYTELSYVQANKYRLRGWSLQQIAEHKPRKWKRK